MPPPIITLDELEQILERAESEQWDCMTILGPRVHSAWRQYEPDGRTFCLSGSIEASMSRLADLGSLRTLTLPGHALGNDGARALAAFPTGLTSLDLGQNNVGAEGAKALAAGLPGLTSLDLGHNRVGAEGAKALAVGLPGLTLLDLSGNRVGAEGAKALAAGLPGLTSLDLGHNSVGAEGAKALAAGLPSLTSLDLGQNGVGAEGAKTLAAGLPGLTLLDLSDNRVGAEGAKALAAGLPGLTSLDLGANGVGNEGTKALAAGLPGLTSLDLSDNGVGNEGTKALAAGLPGLTSLDLWANGIEDEGAKALAAGLRGLTSLDLWANGVGDEGAKALAAGLPGLTSLDLGDNRVGHEGAKALAAGLPRLTLLDLSDNSVGDEGAKALAAGLPGLTSLDLWSNGVGDDGAKAILDLMDRGCLPKLVVLNLAGNDCRELAEIVQSADANAILAGYRRWKAAQQTDAPPLNELKLLVVGNEAVGKTSLINYLVHDKPRDSDERRTPRISIHEKIDTAQWSPDDRALTLNVWDFGGQEIMHGTHRFFLTRRSLYLIVVEARREDDRSVFHWLDVVRNRSGDSPLIVVINKCDPPNEPQLDEAALVNRHGVVAVAHASCNDDDESRQHIQALRDLICETVDADERLDHVRRPMPAAWVRLKSSLADMARQRRIVSTDEFRRLCEATGEDIPDDERILDPDEQRLLLALMHDLGVVVAHGLDREALSARDVNLLDPNWLTTAIYAVIEFARSADAGGIFRRDQLDAILDPQDYIPDHHHFIIDMMEHDDIALCFQIPGNDGAYLIPNALPRNEPDLTQLWPADSLCMEVQYGFLPDGLLPRFIVQAHRLMSDNPTRWRTGVVLEVGECRALVRADRENDRVSIRITGPVHHRTDALAVIRDHLDVVHDLNPEARPVPMIPLPDRPDLTVSYDYVIKLRDQYGPQHKFIPPVQDLDVREYVVSELLHGFDHESPIDEEPDVATSKESNQREPDLRRVITLLLTATGCLLLVIVVVSLMGVPWWVLVTVGVLIVVLLGYSLLFPAQFLKLALKALEVIGKRPNKS